MVRARCGMINLPRKSPRRRDLLKPTIPTDLNTCPHVGYQGVEPSLTSSLCFGTGLHVDRRWGPMSAAQ
jgi:hypothetical protein